MQIFHLSYLSHVKFLGHEGANASIAPLGYATEVREGFVDEKTETSFDPKIK